MTILIRNNQTKLDISLKQVKTTARIILNGLGFPDAELSIMIVDDDEIAVLNRTYLNHQGPTNVISFPMREGQESQISPQLLGDVVISIETAKREGEAAGTGMEERFTQLLVHGILHLAGYDHVNDEAEALEMEARSNELLAVIKRKAEGNRHAGSGCQG